MFSGKIGEVIHSIQSDGRVFERYRRPPGTRLIIITPDKKILITKEHRHEAGGVDLRLPGGKVCDTLEQYHDLLANEKSIEAAAYEAAKKEALEEAGLIIKDMRLITRANAGATVEWDLYYCQVESYEESEHGQELELGENIEVTYMSSASLKRLFEQDRCRNGVALEYCWVSYSPSSINSLIVPMQSSASSS